MIHSHCTAITILPEGEPLFSERATEIKIVDGIRGANPFVYGGEEVNEKAGNKDAQI